MTASERIPYHVEINRIIELLAKQIYPSPLALLRENCQNAYDAILLRRHLSQSFQPEIAIVLEPTQVRITDNGIGMTKQELVNHYWKAGSSGKNTPEARAAGVVGTFGIGAMSNFGVASALMVTSESAKNGERTRCVAVRETLSVTEDCIDMIPEQSTGQPGTTIVAQILPDMPLDVDAASAYITEFVRHLDIPVTVNGKLVSQEEFETSVVRPPSEREEVAANAVLGSRFTADVELAIAKTGEVWLSLKNIRYSDTPISGVVLLRQGIHQIRTFRSRFGLATAAVSSAYNFGGVANLTVLEPTAGREALTTSSLQLLQSIVTECETYVSERFASTPLSDMNTGFMQWVAQHGRFELCSKLSIRLEPENRRIPLEEVKVRSGEKPFNYFEGSDQSLIGQYATDEQPLLVLSTAQPRRKCEVAYLQSYCNLTRIVDTPKILSRKPESAWTLAESAFALRMMSIIESDYFVKVRVGFGKISHGLPVLIETSTDPIEIVLDSDGATVAMILKMYEEDFSSLTGMVKDFVRNIIFPKIASFVPSSTRQGAEAFLRAIRRPRDVFEYERADLGSLSEIWQEYLDGKIGLAAAARASTTIVRANVQVVDRATTTNVADVLPDVLENERILEQTAQTESTDELEALPAITRLEKQSSAKLLTIADDEAPFKGYRCFIAITDRVRVERGEFFLQPHRTEIVWGGQKALYIFQHHSGQFGLYYELQGTEVLSGTPGGRAFPTCTIVLNNQIYVPVPNEIREKFIPQEVGRKRFEIRCELLYPELDASATDEKVQK